MDFSSPKAVLVLDMDGTLIPQRSPSLWEAVRDHLFVGDQTHLLAEAHRVRTYYKTKSDAGTMTPEEEREWFYKTTKLYFQAELNQNHFADALAPIRFRNGVKELLEFAKQEEIPTAIISYGMAQAVEEALRGNDVDHLIDRVYSGRLIAGENGHFVAVDEHSIVLPRNKGEWSLQFAEKHGVVPERILAVGDTLGDITIGHLVKHRLGVSDHPEKVERLKQTGAFGEVHLLENEHFASVMEWVRKKLLWISSS